MANPDAVLLIHGKKQAETDDPYSDYLWVPEVEQRAKDLGVMTYRARMRSMANPNAKKWVEDIDSAYQTILGLGARTVSVVTYSAGTWAYLEWANSLRASGQSRHNIHPSEREMAMHVNPWFSRRQKYEEFFRGTSIMESTIAELIEDTRTRTKVLADPCLEPADGDMSVIGFVRMLDVPAIALTGMGDLKSAEVAEPILTALGLND